MRDVPDHGLHSWSQLKASGIGSTELRRRCEVGQLRRIAHGWYATYDADPDAVAAIQAGARLTCLSAARFHGLWVPPFEGLHVYARRGAVPLGHSRHGPYLDAWPEQGPVASLGLCLQHATQCLPPEGAAVLFESALNSGHLTVADLPALFESVPRTIRRKIGVLSLRSESGTETRLARWFRSRRVSFRQQVEIDGVGRVDFVVGRSWIVEADSKAHHTALRNYENDRRRDLPASRMGYRITRLSYSQVWRDWDDTRDQLAAMLATRQHRRWPRQA
ncbi:type IV toxin-antitoxin system AbiEi family antitoxin domain-containing protein [Ruania alba]|uniref:Very-short-patch-repair endonuclease n=1 Tax=Ruania alba TaxID=648782 RepID=A0A1H5K8H3_9MICO|nr:type IV toxin-antitoxin system AbiEi family antitoxin domain-containing protein [Ruania alba]SEE61112.1 Very-short-patch-repair endonuclease [Ruania alba]